MRFYILGRININRLTKWLKDILQESVMDSRLPPSGTIQVDSDMLHYLTKETMDDSNLILAAADSYIKVALKFNYLYH